MELSDLMLLAAANQRARNGTARQIRKNAGWTLGQMADAVRGVGPSAISRWEGGSRQPRGDAALRWAAILADLERVAANADANAA